MGRCQVGVTMRNESFDLIHLDYDSSVGNEHSLGRRTFLGLLGGAVASLVIPIGSAVAAPKTVYCK